MTAENWRGDELALIERVPAWVCDREGHVFYDPDVSRALDQLHREPPQPLRRLSVPVYSYDLTREPRRAAS